MSAILSVAVPSFLASLVEFVEALTIVLAVSTTRGWRPALLGATGGALLLAAVVAALGPLLTRIPSRSLELCIGVLLLFFGMRWLRKAILRYAGVIPLHDEAKIYATQTGQLRTKGPVSAYDWPAIVTAFNAVTLEGLEVVFIVIALGATAAALGAAALGAALAGGVVVGAGFVLHAPLARVPENLLKFAVGIMLSAFGTYWTGEGLGLAWPGNDLALLELISGFLVTSLAGVALARSRDRAATPAA